MNGYSNHYINQARFGTLNFSITFGCGDILQVPRTLSLPSKRVRY